MTALAPAAAAFDAVAERFDARFGEWKSVQAQRRAVRTALAEAFPPSSSLIEIGGGTGEDAAWLGARGRRILLTDASPAMAAIAAVKLARHEGMRAEACAAEHLERLAQAGEDPFDGAYSNFAALNCVIDLKPFARGLARLLRPGAPVLLVVFGACCPGEVVVESLRGRPGAALRRLRRGPVPARLGGHAFEVRYHRAGELARALAPWFKPQGRQGIGVFVPPSAAEPWISRRPALLNMLERLDRRLCRPLAVFGDHILYRFVRTQAEAGD